MHSYCILQVGTKQVLTHTPSIAFRHLSLKEGCRKLVIGVWAWPWPLQMQARHKPASGNLDLEKMCTFERTAVSFKQTASEINKFPVSVLSQIYFISRAFWWDSFYMLMWEDADKKKQEEKKQQQTNLRFQQLHFYWSFSSNIVATKRSGFNFWTGDRICTLCTFWNAQLRVMSLRLCTSPLTTFPQVMLSVLGFRLTY